MRLRDALRVQRGDVIAFVGAGGKTSALFRLADELQRDGWRVLATTTTRVATEEIERAPLAVRLTDKTTPAMIRRWLSEYHFVFLYGTEDVARDKIIGLHTDVIPGLMDSVNSDALLIEADGARRLPLKAPYDHEPVIPAETSLVVPVAGMDVLGQPFDDEHVYNAARIRERYGFPDGAAVIPPWVAVTMRDMELGLRGVPEAARVVALLNKVPANGYDRRRARRVAELVLRSDRVEAVALGAMRAYQEPVHELQRRVSAVVLAAGMSTRMGRSKALLAWDGGTVIQTIVSRLVAARIPDIVVVTGHQSDRVAVALANQPVRIVANPDYASGEMLSSLQVGLQALSPAVSSALVVMGDQPALDIRVVNDIIATYARGDGAIVAPVYGGRRGHPVLFDRQFWPELLALKSGAPRDVVNQHLDQLATVAASSDSILRDIDTPEQYRRELYRFQRG